MTRDFSEYQLKDAKGNRIFGIPPTTVGGTETLTFVEVKTIEKVAASNWSETEVNGLGLGFAPPLVFQEFVNQVLKKDYTNDASLGDLGDSLLKALEPLSPNIVNEFVDNRDVTYNLPEVIKNNWVGKAAAVVMKYCNVESGVDTFVFHLLLALGFNDGRTCVFPQLPHKLTYGVGATIDSTIVTPDITVVDLLTYSRIAVVEDKTSQEKSPQKNPAAQLVAEIYAVHQTEMQSLKRSFQTLTDDNTPTHVSTDTSAAGAVVEQEKELTGYYGIVVRETYFCFYYVPILQSALNALQRKEGVPKPHVCIIGSEELNFLKKDHRHKIVWYLCQLREIVGEQGSSGGRRASHRK